ncbi:GT-D fold domain-containing protein [Paenibacillus cremeus]|uniref:GT-D fold-like domain-containing protein n=1 Tax=Paenibacillus cremeus TaxID=2163881 RepID=A0A559KD35_9BACL|nr:GT-D fold domain-containing glycosyltransferase [Paenibacillus cremeus]TVY10041.1 hypothetical protein FPZ49_09960 [Paenibacillus cremeus]
MLNSVKRVRIIESRYKRRTVGAGFTYRLIQRSIRTGQAVSVIRLGDVMGKLLARRQLRSLSYVSSFLGIHLPPSAAFLRELEQAVRAATVVGVSHYLSSINHIQAFLRRTGWRPPYIADSFINDQLYQKGYLHRLLRSYRVALVGRAAPRAAKQLRKQGIRVALTVPLNHYRELGRTLGQLAKQQERFDLVLVGASVPGRILCPRIVQQLGKSAIEIGHMMDAFAHPREWTGSNYGTKRQRFKFRWLRRLKRNGGTRPNGQGVKARRKA